jgi:uncharacterized protein (TIGR03067 family)
MKTRRGLRWWLAALLLTAGAVHAGEREEQLRFQGTWRIVEQGNFGQTNKQDTGQMVNVAGDRFSFSNNIRYTMKLAPTREPREIDLVGLPDDPNTKNAKFKGIYRLEGDTLTIHFALNAGERPTDFKGTAKSTPYVMVFQRDRQK